MLLYNIKHEVRTLFRTHLGNPVESFRSSCDETMASAKLLQSHASQPIIVPALDVRILEKIVVTQLRLRVRLGLRQGNGTMHV